ncbi:PCRF domain-containing protein [Nostoc sp. CENA67]|uniref:PCRF domain-containing protein n=1 Tax=Amazonocrinis nigriterrae CENA67 TaxID=2794033 RepID=A0A8J7HVB6_9NOST|nr:PCRF domain-containing protein [Amazonocrinis nigriterrae]MBH8566653.1 PCRF domain-containing protein [Amazonocrinis nigriterrae CENA67]
MPELSSIKIEVERLSNILVKAEDCLDLGELNAKIQDLEQIIAQPTFWHNSVTAHQTLQEIQFLNAKKKQYQRSHSILADINAALELLEVTADEQLLQEAQANLTQLQRELETLEIQQLLTQPCDQKGAFLTITAGIGDVDAEDWAFILLKLYHRWALNHNYRPDVVAESDGDIAGIKYAVLEITGHYAYGCLKSEIGTHQLQRLSPFGADKNLKTSLASVEVSPILDESCDFDISQKDLEITLARAKGNVNRTKTWAQVVHLPTGITVFCDSDRSQMENKAKALAILKSKLWALMQAQGVNQISAIQPRQMKSLSNKLIREYILHPNTKVKDLRTLVQTTAVAEVLDGGIDLFIKAYLQQEHQTTVPSQ